MPELLDVSIASIVLLTVVVLGTIAMGAIWGRP
jgi:hypothetical protein